MSSEVEKRHRSWIKMHSDNSLRHYTMDVTKTLKYENGAVATEKTVTKINECEIAAATTAKDVLVSYNPYSSVVEVEPVKLLKNTKKSRAKPDFYESQKFYIRI
jgi:hypothetical protein